MGLLYGRFRGDPSRSCSATRYLLGPVPPSRWRYWNRWFKSETKASPTSVVSVHTNENYTRLVLRNPKKDSARGGSFVYISAPGALGTDEAHAITVAIRGAPPAASTVSEKGVLAPSSGAFAPAQQQEDVFTVYVKDLGPWTKALRNTAESAQAVADPAAALLVDVDGFYTQLESFNSMRIGGASRVVIVAGGSGMTSLFGFIQDWCVAAAQGAPVPEVHLAWCCRSMSEMELVGEALPSLLASAGAKKDTHFSMSLYCSGKVAIPGQFYVPTVVEDRLIISQHGRFNHTLLPCTSVDAHHIGK